MLLLMIVWAVGAILLFAHEGFEDLFDVWQHPDRRITGDDPHHPAPRHK